MESAWKRVGRRKDKSASLLIKDIDLHTIEAQKAVDFYPFDVDERR